VVCKKSKNLLKKIKKINPLKEEKTSFMVF
jgi:hypothetical protein